MSEEYPPTPFALPNDECEDQLPQRFEVNDDPSANWVVKRIVAARAYGKRIKHWAETEQRRARREEAFFLNRFGLELDRWLRRKLAERGGKAKSFNLPAGRVGVRHIGPKIEVINEDAVLAWAREHCPEAIKQTESLLKTPLTEHVEATGELPAGTILKQERDEIYVR